MIGLGCNAFGERIDGATSARVVHAALDAGITLFDTADGYGGGASEEMLGAALKGRRDEAVIATKFSLPTGPRPHNRGASRGHILTAVNGSLRRLGVDHVDLYQQHVPDANTPIEETLSALDDAVRAGKIRYIGSSNFPAWQLAEAEWAARAIGTERFVSVQNNYSLVIRDVEREVVPLCQRYGLGLIPCFPLASGLLTGKYKRGAPIPPGSKMSVPWSSRMFLSDRNFDVVEGLAKFAAERGASLLQLAIGALAAQPFVSSVIAGASRPEQVLANVEAGNWVPTPEDLEEINRLAPGI